MMVRGTPTPEDLQRFWNAYAPALPSCLRVTGKTRRKAARARLREEPNMIAWKYTIQRMNRSSFLQGQNDRGWKATFDFLVQDGTMTKVQEGKYDDRTQGPIAPKDAARQVRDANISHVTDTDPPFTPSGRC
jgi:hypothetical protein